MSLTGFLLLVQLVLPLVLLAWLLVRPLRSRIGWLVQVLATSALLAWLAVAGVWTVPPWWAPWAYGAVLVVAVVAGARRLARLAMRPSRPLGWLVVVALGGFGAWAGHEALRGALGWRAPAVAAVPLRMPLEGGTFLVLNGGDDIRINAHLKTRDVAEPRFARWRGNAWGVDLVAIDRFGLRASGIAPTDNTRYRSFGWPVLAPCDGTVVQAVDGLPDMIPPTYDVPARLTGNHVMLACGEVRVVLAHFRQGSVRVRPGDRVTAGQPIAELGNSGGSDEAHLHVHAQRPGPADAPMGGEPLPATFDGRFLVRGDRVSPPARPPQPR